MWQAILYSAYHIDIIPLHAIHTFTPLFSSNRANSTHSHSHRYHSYQQSLRYFSQWSPRQEPNEQESVVRICTALIFPCFLKNIAREPGPSTTLMFPCFPNTWPGITALTIADTLSLKIRKSTFFLSLLYSIWLSHGQL